MVQNDRIKHTWREKKKTTEFLWENSRKIDCRDKDRRKDGVFVFFQMLVNEIHPGDFMF